MERHGLVHPFRGDQVAAGAVALAAVAALAEARWGGRWWLGVPAAVVLLLLAAEAGGPRRAYHAALELSAFVALAAALAGAGAEPGVVAAGCAAAAAWFAVRRSSPPMALLAPVAVGATALLLLGRSPWPLLAIAIACTLGAVWWRDRRPDHAEALAEAGGLAVAGTLVLEGGAGWELLGAAAGFGLVALGGVERRRGQVLVGLLVLALWARVAEPAWIAVLGLAALAFLVSGLRPARPLPPEPEPPGGVAAPIVLPRAWRGRSPS
jgi:hypothetical protein